MRLATLRQPPFMSINAKTASTAGTYLAGWFIALWILAFVLPTHAAEWQWSQSVDSITIGNSTEHPRAFLWIPPDCKQVRAIVFGQNNMIEEGILQHPYFRQAMAKLGIAELFVAPTFDTW